ncbi:MAG: hypothetical protein ACETWK_07495 [Candidatus Aminicenantaceae bacterium]
MKLLERKQIETLNEFKSRDFLTTSFYLDTDKSKRTKKEINLAFKNLIGKNRTQADKMDVSREKRESLNQDLDKINHFFKQNSASYNYPGLAIFSCAREDFWQVFSLPDPPRNTVFFDHNPYVRPLSAILDEYHRICTLLINRREAAWYEVYMGEISRLKHLTADVPPEVREGGWEGYESKRIERHVATHLREHFKNVAQITFNFFKKNHFNWLFLGCKDEHCVEFESLLHPYTKSSLKGRVKAKSSDSVDKVLKESLQLEKKLKKEEEDEIIDQLISELEKGGLAISGVKDTLKKLNRGEVQTLVITRNFAKPGKICPRCNFLFLDELRCPSCRIKTERVVDVIDEAVEASMDKKSRVKHINPPSKLRRYGNIGAFLRYKT